MASNLQRLVGAHSAPNNEDDSQLPYNQFDNCDVINTTVLPKSGCSSSSPLGESQNSTTDGLHRRHNGISATDANSLSSSLRSSHPLFPSRGRQFHHFYENQCTTINRRLSSNRKTLTLGRPIPSALMKAIYFLLGINENVSKRTIMGTVLLGVTIAVAIGYMVASLIYIHKDIMSDFTKTSVMDGTVSALFNLVWCVLGIYSNGLAYRLYNDDHFKPLLRLPSKTFFGLNSAAVMLTLMLVAIIVNDYAGLWMFASQSCDKLWLSVVACKFRYIFRVIFSVFAFLWHFLVMFVVISVSRSFTINIRQLMRCLERDGRVYESVYMGIKSGQEDRLLQEYVWLDQEFCEEIQLSNEQHNSVSEGNTAPDDQIQEANFVEMNGSSASLPEDTNTPSVEIRMPSSQPSPSSSHASKQEKECMQDATTSVDSKLLKPTLMSNDEILYHIWKLQSGLRVFGLATQRWLLSLLCLLVSWLVVNLIVWLKTSPSLVDLVNLVLPLLLLPLLVATFAEVNFEGERLVKFIAPTEERLSVLFFLQQSPLQLTVYGFSLSYQTITTAGLALLLALFSKIFLQEIID